MPIALNDKQVLVIGLGATGLSALRWLQGQGARLSVADTRESPPGLEAIRTEMPDVNVLLGALSAELLLKQDLIVISPGLSVQEPALQQAIAHKIPVIGDVELFAQYRGAEAKMIAITGSNGKSTVTTLVGEMCKASGLRTVVAGNIGLPVLDTLKQATPDVYVLELSSFQLETTYSLNADAATVLNLSEDHMDRYDSMQAYAAAKARIFAGHGIQVLNRQDAWSAGMEIRGRPCLHFGTDTPINDLDFGMITHADERWLACGRRKLIPLKQLKIAGLHNASNALAALALCKAIGLNESALLNTLRTFTGLPHRVEWVREIGGVSFYDDSKGTNVGATCAAIAGLPQPVVLIAGGDGKGQDFSPLRQAVEGNARAVVLIGRDAHLIEAALKGMSIQVLHAISLPAAVQLANELAMPGDAVLLSPACASFDMFQNYQHRAEVFCNAVHALNAGVGSEVAS